MVAVTAVTLGVVLSRMETLLLILFAVAKSGLPSPLKSPLLTERGSLPVRKKTWGAKVGVTAPVGVVLSRIKPFWLNFSVKAKSGRPSPLKSLMLTEVNPVPVGKSSRGAKVGVVALVVVLSRMETPSLLKLFAVAMSGRPSPLKSPMLRDWGQS